MTDNKLFDSILQSGQARAEEILKDAQTKADAVLAAAEQEAAAEADGIIAAAQQQAQRTAHAAESSAALTARNAVLEAKRKAIGRVIDGIYEAMDALDDKSYFALLYRIAATVRGDYDTVLLNARDLKRVPADFEAQLAAAGVKASLGDMPADMDGGFLLKKGAIETNCSFRAIVEDRRSEIEDFIHRALFTQEGE